MPRNSKKINLGVNLDHVATLRQVRGGTTPYPDMRKVLKQAVKGGADQITIHLREDRRHIQEQDLALYSKICPVSLNLEMAGTQEMLRLALKYKPDWVCFVPEKRQELTTEGGLNVRNHLARYRNYVKSLKSRSIKTSMFIDPSLQQVKASYAAGAEAIELHTGKWVRLKGDKRRREWERLKKAANKAHELGLLVHAGHGLDFKTARAVKRLPHLKELNIGHFLICESLNQGLEKAVRDMTRCMRLK